VGKTVKKAASTFGQRVGQAAKATVKAVVKYNPLSLAVRGDEVECG
jgi:hypothetical protein